MSEHQPINETNGHATSPNNAVPARETEPHNLEESVNIYGTSLPARFQAVHESDHSLYMANEHRGQYVEAEEIVLPHRSLESVFNLRMELEETDIEAVREALEEALAWLHRIESNLATSAEVAE